MTKKILIPIALFLMAALLFVACGGGAGQAPERGSWDGVTYTNESLGLRFHLPEGWEVSTDAQLAARMRQAADVFDDMSLELIETHSFIDMHAESIATHVSVQINYERLTGTLTEAQYIEVAQEQFSLLGGEVIPHEETIRIGAYDWHAFDTRLAMDAASAVTYGRQLLSIHEGFVRLIVITYYEHSESADEILQLFTAL